MTPTMIPIATHDPFVLYVHTQRGDWLNLKLVRTGPRHKNQKKWNWWIAWNGERIANSHDAGVLNQHHPDLYRWVLTTLRSQHPCHSPTTTSSSS